MNKQAPRDDFYRICSVAAVLILAVAAAVPTLKDPGADTQAQAQPTPVAGTVQSALQPVAQHLQPVSAAAYGG